MAYTQAQLDKLEANRALGVLSVEYGGKKTVFRTDAEMGALIQEIKDTLNPPASFMNRRFMGVSNTTLNRVGRRWEQ
jgi:hypothetical protein